MAVTSISPATVGMREEAYGGYAEPAPSSQKSNIYVEVGSGDAAYTTSHAYGGYTEPAPAHPKSSLYVEVGSEDATYTTSHANGGYAEPAPARSKSSLYVEVGSGDAAYATSHTYRGYAAPAHPKSTIGVDENSENSASVSSKTKEEKERTSSEPFDSQSLGILTRSLSRYYHRGYFVDQVSCTLDQLRLMFGKMSLSNLGNGYSSNAFVLTPESSDQKHVLRIFSPTSREDSTLRTSYILDRSNVGGEWLSVVIEDENVESNTHIIALDPENGSIKILDRKTVMHLIENRDTLEVGKKLIAIGTIGNFQENSQDLSKVLSQKHAIRDDEELRPILRGLFQGVAAINSANICHRDLKLDNIILLDSRSVRIIDFGSAAYSEKSGKTATWGGFLYIHPIESYLQEKRFCTQKTDSYSLFRVVYHLKTGKDFFSTVPFSQYGAKHLEIFKDSRTFREILNDDPNLEGVNPDLIDLMAQLGTSKCRERILAKDALQMPYFANREIESLVA